MINRKEWVKLGAEWAEEPTTTREELIDWLCYNDTNGCYTDEDCDAEGLPRLTLETARDQVLTTVEDEQNAMDRREIDEQA